MRRRWKFALSGILYLGLQGATADTHDWIATWAAAPQLMNPDPANPLCRIDGQTVRERVKLSVGGTSLRIRLSNEFGSTPALVGAATVALPTDAGGVKAGTVHTLRFGGRGSVTIPAGAPALSDPVDFSVPAGAEISVSLYFPGRITTPTGHVLALRRTIISSRGDQTGAEHIVGADASDSSVLLSGVFVPAFRSQRLIVGLGDSITDGDGSTQEANRNWISDLARRFAATPEGSNVAVVNEGIAGNRLLGDGYGVSALARFDRDVLALPGVTHIVLLEGINDLGFPGARLGESYLADPADMRTSEDLISAYRQIIARAHAAGIKVIGATLTPFEGVDVPGYYSESKEVIRNATNRWIRTSGEFDGVLDFDAVLRDPSHPSRMLARFTSPDHLHPNDVGYQALADSIDLSLFQ